MKKYFVSSDIHSFYTLWKKELKKKGFDEKNPEHILIICGDLFDRGKEAIKCLNFVCKMIKQDRAICICGNHEDLLTELLKRKMAWLHDMSNGTEDTVYQFEKLFKLKEDEYLDFDEICEKVLKNKKFNLYINSLKDYYETPKHIFVHGYIPCGTGKYGDKNYRYNPDWRNDSFYWAKWVNGMDAWSCGIKEEGKTIVCGHWHTSFGNYNLHNVGNGEFEKDSDFETFKDDGIMALDGCIAFSGKVNVEVIEEEDL